MRVGQAEGSGYCQWPHGPGGWVSTSMDRRVPTRQSETTSHAQRHASFAFTRAHSPPHGDAEKHPQAKRREEKRREEKSRSSRCEREGRFTAKAPGTLWALGFLGSRSDKPSSHYRLVLKSTISLCRNGSPSDTSIHAHTTAEESRGAHINASCFPCVAHKRSPTDNWCICIR